MIVLLSRLYELLYASEAIASYEYTVRATTISRQGAMLAPIRLTNEARAASASHSGETQGDASPPPVPTTPAPTRLFYDGSHIRITRIFVFDRTMEIVSQACVAGGIRY